MANPVPLPSFMRSLEVRKKVNAFGLSPESVEKRKLLSQFAEQGIQSENKLLFLTTANKAKEEGFLDDTEWRTVFEPLAASFQQTLCNGSVYAASHL